MLPLALSGFSLGGRSDASGHDPSSLTLRHSYSPRSTPLLAETWELPSLSHLACIPYYKHFRCKIIQCPRTPPLLDVRPRGRNQDNRVLLCCLLHHHLGRGNTQYLLVGIRAPGLGHRHYSPRPSRFWIIFWHLHLGQLDGVST